MSFTNVREFKRDAALKYEKNGYYCGAPRGTKEWVDYWNEQQNRCLNGYSIGNTEITGYHYFYLNFGRIEAVYEDEHGNPVERMGFPRFYDWDYNFFWALEIAKNGVSEDKYNSLGLDINIDDITGDNHLAVIKARRKGYSYKAASMLARNFCMKQNSKNYAMVSDSEYLLGDGLFSKTWDNLAFMEDSTPFGQPKLTDQKMKKVAGYKVKKGGIEIEKGTKNQIIGISLKDDPEKAVGKSGELGFFEEAGKFPGLIEAWEACKPSYEQGKYTTGTMIAYGTGGTQGADYEGLEELFFSPTEYNVLPIKNQWDDGASDNTCSFFVPAYVNLEGFMDNNGNSDIDGAAKKYLEQEREEKEGADDPRGYNKHIAQFPFTPREATMRVDNNIFPTAEVENQRAGIIANKKQKELLTAGRLTRKDGEVQFNPDKSVQPIFKFPTPKNSNRKGGVVVKETPYQTSEGVIPNNMYMICHDPYAHDGSPEGSSLGAAYVIKRISDIDTTYMNCPVASYVGRPLKQDDYNRNLFLLAEYYNAKIAFENNRGNVMEYAKNNNLLHYLYPSPDINENKQRNRPRTTRKYGLAMTSKNMKNQAEVYIRDWLLEEYGGRDAETGERERILDKIVDPALLKEIANYNQDGNFDRVSALMVGMFYLRQLQNQRVTAQTNIQKHRDFFNRDLFPKNNNTSRPNTL